MHEAERNATAIILALISAAVLADFLTHGQVTTTLATTGTNFLTTGLKIASGQNA
jgi:hypothetical protein